MPNESITPEQRDDFVRPFRTHVNTSGITVPLDDDGDQVGDLHTLPLTAVSTAPQAPPVSAPTEARRLRDLIDTLQETNETRQDELEREKERLRRKQTALNETDKQVRLKQEEKVAAIRKEQQNVQSELQRHRPVVLPGAIPDQDDEGEARIRSASAQRLQAIEDRYRQEEQRLATERERIQVKIENAESMVESAELSLHQAVEELTHAEGELTALRHRKEELSLLDSTHVTSKFYKTTRTTKINELLTEYNQLEGSDLEGRRDKLTEVSTTARAWLLDSQHDQASASKRLAIIEVLQSVLKENEAVAFGLGPLDPDFDPERQRPLPRLAWSEDGLTGLGNTLALNDATSLRDLRALTETLSMAHQTETNYDEQLSLAWQSTKGSASDLVSRRVGEAWDNVCTVLKQPIVSKFLSVVGLAAAAKGFFDAWRDRKALQASIKTATGDLLVAARFGLAKVRRRFYLAVKSLTFSLVQVVMHTITVLTGGAAAAFTEAMSLALVLTEATINLGLALRGFIKWCINERGKKRRSNASTIVNKALDEFRAATPDSSGQIRRGPAMNLLLGFGHTMETIQGAVNNTSHADGLIQAVATNLRSKN